MVAQLLVGALAKANGPDGIPPLLADDPSDPFAINSDPFSVLNLACLRAAPLPPPDRSLSSVCPDAQTEPSVRPIALALST